MNADKVDMLAARIAAREARYLAVCEARRFVYQDPHAYLDTPRRDMGAFGTTLARARVAIQREERRAMNAYNRALGAQVKP